MEYLIKAVNRTTGWVWYESDLPGGRTTYLEHVRKFGFLEACNHADRIARTTYPSYLYDLIIVEIEKESK